MAIYLGTNKVSNAGTNGGYMINGRFLTTKTYTFNLGQTNYSSITPTTTAQALTLPATVYSTSPSTSITCLRVGENYDGTIIDRNDHDYVIFCYLTIDYNYGSNNVASTIHGIRFAYAKEYPEGKYRNSVNASTGILTNTYTKGSNIVGGTTTVLLYRKANNTYAIKDGSNGIYGACSASMSSEGTPLKDYISLTCNGFNVKANTSYCPVEALKAINPAGTIVTVQWDIYEGDRSSYTNVYDKAYELVANK